MATPVYIVSEGECGEGSTVKGVYSSLEDAKANTRKQGSLHSFREWVVYAPGTWVEREEWKQFDTEGWEYNRIERWEVA